MDNADPFSHDEAYWGQRVQLDTLRNGLRRKLIEASLALREHRLAELRQLLLEAKRLEDEIAFTSRALDQTVAPSELGPLFRRGIAVLREHAQGTDIADRAALRAFFEGLIDLERDLQLPAEERSTERAFARVLTVWGEQAIRQGDLDQAETTLELALKHDQGAMAARIALGRLLIERSSRARARGAPLESAVSWLDHAERLLQSAPRHQEQRAPDDLPDALRRERVALLLALGMQAGGGGQRQLARRYLLQARELAPAGSPYALQVDEQLRTWAGRRVRSWVFAIVAVLGLSIVGLLTLHSIAPSAICSGGRLGGALCPPTPTTPPMTTGLPIVIAATSTMIAERTPTPQATPTASPSPPLTPTREPLLGVLRNDQVAVYDDPVRSDTIIAELRFGTSWHLCARAGRRYLIASDDCARTTPLGWVTETNFDPQFEGRFPQVLITPLPDQTPRPTP